MMRILIPFVAALGLSLGVSTGVVIMRAPHPAPGAVKGDSTHAGVAAKNDSTAATPAPHTDSAGADSAHTDVAHADSTPAAAVATATPAATQADANDPHIVAGSKGLTPATLARDIPAHGAGAVSSAHERSDSSEKRVAKVFAAMQARDAANILQQMDDGDVGVILASLSPKQQAAILGQFPTQRAATLTRATLRDGVK